MFAKKTKTTVARDVDDYLARLPEDVLAVDEALEQLAAADPATAELVKLVYFAGLTMEQAADALGLSQRTAERNWTFARTWLHRELSDQPAEG